MGKLGARLPKRLEKRSPQSAPGVPQGGPRGSKRGARVIDFSPNRLIPGAAHKPPRAEEGAASRVTSAGKHAVFTTGKHARRLENRGKSAKIEPEGL